MDANTAQILTLLIAALSSAFGLWVAMQNRRMESKQDRMENQQGQIHNELSVVKEEINGHSELLRAAVKGEATAVGKAAGVQQERADQRVRDQEQPPPV